MTFADINRFARKTSFKKIYNIARLYTSYQYSKISGQVRHRGLPMTLSIEPTTACNLRCPECPSGLRSFTRPTGNLKGDFFREMIDQVYPHLNYLIFYFQGEPYINPDFLDMVNYAHGKHIYTITSTNAHFLDEENARRTVESGLDRIIISIDGTTQEVYESYRREGRLEKVVAGARNLIKWRNRLRAKNPHIIFQFLVVRPNEHQVRDVQRLAGELGV